jgi:exodeoxyribonuclease VII large subunit
MTEAADRLNIPEWTVSELSAALKRTVEDAYGYVRVRGEVSGFKGASPSGHCYFRLKDDRAVLESVIWKTTFGRLRIKPQEGLEVVVTGRLTTFAGSSKYQIVVETLEPAGLGALMALLEERKKKLAAEGLFDAARKQLLPYLPEVIGVVTSPTGAVIRDILHRLADRFPRHVIVWPVRVQGEDSANEVAAAINGFNALGAGGRIPRPDLIIVARGGGSLEDLWSFNEEIVVRAAAASMIPLISAVGHETDVTLIDFAADVRAPTPTAAAEMAVPVRAELMVRIDSLARRGLACWQRNQETRRTELRAAIRALPRAEDLLAQPRQRLDHASARLPRALTANAQIHHRQFSGVAGRLGPQLLRARLAGERQRVGACVMRARHCLRVAVERRRDRFAAIADRGERAAFAVIDAHWARLERASALLTAFSYQGVLERGFALVRAPTGKPLRDAASVNVGMRLDIEFADGRVRATAEARDTSKVRPPPRPRRRRGGGGEGQGSLFE